MIITGKGCDQFMIIKDEKIDLILSTSSPYSAHIIASKLKKKYDIPWIADPVRENGGAMRNELFEIYKEELIQYKFNYKVVNGIGDERFKIAYNHVNEFLDQKR